MNDINLASGLLVKSVEKSNFLKNLRLAALISIFVLGLSSVILFFLINQASPDKIKKQEEKILLSLNYLRPKEAKLIVVNDRIGGISKIINDRLNYASEMQKIIDIIPQDVTLTSIEIDSKKVSLTVSSISLKAMDKVIGNLKEMAQKKEIIKDLTMGGISYVPAGGTYTLSFKSNKL